MKVLFYNIYVSKIRLILKWLLVYQFFSFAALAQYENVWIFGQNAGLDFNAAGGPVAIRSAIAQGVNVFGEANASVCDENGNLLFYTEGYRVIDRRHSLMPNGDSLAGMHHPLRINSSTVTSSTAQGALIVPKPGSNTLYYIFSLTSHEAGSVLTGADHSRLYYSVVDLRLNSGYGDVVVEQKAIPFDSLLTERMTAVKGNCNNIWLLTVTQNKEVKAYEITTEGINPNPEISTITSLGFQYNGAGMIVVSPDRYKVAITNLQADVLPKSGLALFDFDGTTGRLSNEMQLLPDTVGYGACFSPDNSKLYFIEYGSRGIIPKVIQYDLLTGSLNNIINSKNDVLTGAQGHLKLGPDGKIYFPGLGNGTLSVIHQPNLYGSACQPHLNAIDLLPNTGMRLGLPNVIARAYKDTVYHTGNFKTCDNHVALQANDTVIGEQYVWNDGNIGKSREIYRSGTYWVHYQTSCKHYIDTFNV